MYMQTEHGKRSRIQDVTVELDSILNDHRNRETHAKETNCMQILIDSELVPGRHVSTYAPNCFYPTFLEEKLQHIFRSLQCAAKTNMPLGFVFGNVQDEVYR